MSVVRLSALACMCTCASALSATRPLFHTQHAPVLSHLRAALPVMQQYTEPKASETNAEAEDGSGGIRQLLGLKGAKEASGEEFLNWKIRLQLTKPATWVPLIWGVACGAAASGNYHAVWNLFGDGTVPAGTPATVGLVAEDTLKAICAMILAGPFSCGFTQTINDWYDRDLDAINEPYRPIPSGKISEGEVYSQIAFLLAGTFGIAYSLDGWAGNDWPVITAVCMHPSRLLTTATALTPLPPRHTCATAVQPHTPLPSHPLDLDIWCLCRLHLLCPSAEAQIRRLAWYLCARLLLHCTALVVRARDVQCWDDRLRGGGPHSPILDRWPRHRYRQRLQIHRGRSRAGHEVCCAHAAPMPCWRPSDHGTPAVPRLFLCCCSVASVPLTIHMLWLFCVPSSLPVAFGIDKAKWICVASIDVTQLGVAAYLYAIGETTFALVLFGLVLPQVRPHLAILPTYHLFAVLAYQAIGLLACYWHRPTSLLLAYKPTGLLLAYQLTTGLQANRPTGLLSPSLPSSVWRGRRCSRSSPFWKTPLPTTSSTRRRRSLSSSLGSSLRLSPSATTPSELGVELAFGLRPRRPLSHGVCPASSTGAVGRALCAQATETRRHAGI